MTKPKLTGEQERRNILFVRISNTANDMLQGVKNKSELIDTLVKEWAKGKRNF